MKINIRKRNGITLIALVVTIIILLILSAVTISTLTGENGLFKNAKLAKEKSENVQIEENIILDNYENKISEYVDNSRETVTISKEEYEQLKNNINLSKEEKVVGTWIDGKKLYSKTIEANITTDDLQTVNHNIKNVDTIYIDVGNTFFIDSSGATSPFFLVGVSNGVLVDGYLSCIQAVNKTYIQIRAGKNAQELKAYITLKYTKTID